MILAVPYFPGPRADALLLLWERSMRERTRLPACVLVDGDYPVPGNLISVRVDTSPFADCIRPGKPFDRKGAIVAAALGVLPEFCVMDADAIIQHDPTEELAKLKRCVMATRADEWARQVPISNHGIGTQRQAGVMVFGGPTVDRHLMAANYVRSWCTITDKDAFRNDAWAEQMAWSAVWWMIPGAVELPLTLNHSWRTVGADTAHVIHQHGPGKWTRLGIGD